MRIQFLRSAEEELDGAIDFYNAQSEGLGFEFAAEVKRTLLRITAYPKAWSQLSSRTRRCRTNRFPYGIIYQIKQDYILIIAVMHLRRKPQRWKERQ